VFVYACVVESGVLAPSASLLYFDLLTGGRIPKWGPSAYFPVIYVDQRGALMGRPPLGTPQPGGFYSR